MPCPFLPPALNLLMLFAGLAVHDRNGLFAEQTGEAQDQLVANDMALANIVFPKDGCPTLEEPENLRNFRVFLAENTLWEQSSETFTFDIKAAVEVGIRNAFAQCDQRQDDADQSVIPCVRRCRLNYDRVMAVKWLYNEDHDALPWLLQHGGFSDEQIIEMTQSVGNIQPQWASVINVCDDAKERCPETPEEAAIWTHTIQEWAHTIQDASDPTAKTGELFKNIMRGAEAAFQKVECPAIAEIEPAIDALDIEENKYIEC